MNIITFTAGPIDANNYLLKNEDEAVLIDCSELKPEILKELNGVKLKYILLTHGHFDHVLGVNDMKEKTGAKVLIHEKDIPQMENTNSIMSIFGIQGTKTPKADDFVKDSDELTFGNTKIKVIHTPGHTEGGVCYMIDGKLFSGDTLFKDSVGRTDLPGGNFETLSNSIKKILFELDDNIVVYPGHGDETTIGYEKKYNELV